MASTGIRRRYVIEVCVVPVADGVTAKLLNTYADEIVGAVRNALPTINSAVANYQVRLSEYTEYTNSDELEF